MPERPSLPFLTPALQVSDLPGQPRDCRRQFLATYLLVETGLIQMLFGFKIIFIFRIHLLKLRIVK